MSSSPSKEGETGLGVTQLSQYPELHSQTWNWDLDFYQRSPLVPESSSSACFLLF